jgi:predicted component of type VI protein secretion system
LLEPTAMTEGGALLAVLVLRRGLSGAGGHVAVRRPTIRLGRDASNDVAFPSPSVSATHAELRLRGGVWSLTDLGSMNGSWVDGEPVYGAVPLGPGSTVKLGDVEWVFSPKDRWEDSPSELVLDAAPLDASLAPPLDEPSVTPEPLPTAARRFRDEDAPLFVLPEPPRRSGVWAFILVATAVAALAFFLRQAT